MPLCRRPEPGNTGSESGPLRSLKGVAASAATNSRTGSSTELQVQARSSTRAFIAIAPAGRLEREVLSCSICTHLECALESRHCEYLTACSETIRRFSSKHEAYSFVEMERARCDLEMHRTECASAVTATAVLRSPIPVR